MPDCALRWLAEHQGPYVALAAVGGILAFITILVLAVAVSKAKTLSTRSSPGPMFADANGASAYPNQLQQLTSSTVSGIGALPHVVADPPLPDLLVILSSRWLSPFHNS